MGYRMIIADDESMLIELIKRLGKFKEYGIEIVDECYDGEATYESIVTNRPDFVLTDIQMPAMDGLEMIERARRVAPETLFVLLSGYRYFEYAQSAVKLNVVDYLLKPVDEDRLNAILVRLCQMTDERRRETSDREELRSIRDRAIREKLDRFWDQLLLRPQSIPKGTFHADRISVEYGLNFEHPLFRLLAIETRLTERSGARFSFEGKLDELVSETISNKIDYLCCHRGFRFYILLNFQESQLGTMRNAVSGLYYACRELHDAFGEFRLTIGLSEVKRSSEMLPDAADEVNAAIWGRLFFVGDQQIRYDQLNGMERMPSSVLLSEDSARQLADAIRYLKKDVLTAVFSKIQHVLQGHPIIHPREISRLVDRLMDCAIASMVEDERERQRDDLNDAVQAASTSLQLIQSLYTVLELYIDEQKQRIERANRQPVRIALDYIRQHYADAISLDIVAEVAGVSPAYLSKLFREMHDTGFNDYVTRVRLEESMRLLSDTRMSIRSVASSVGYQDEKYYTKLFKKQYGITPTEYRKLYG